MKPKLKIPKNHRILRIGEIRRHGDRFKRCDGKWVKTSDYGSKVREGFPCFPEYPEYAGVYIRKTTT